jgi:peptidoglycan/LPS O-acetylase OafA/YrhL
MAGSEAPSTVAQIRQRYDAIDLLRFLAALSVLLFHYSFRGAAEGGFTTFCLPEIAPFSKYGYLGVELFFIISGFVITMSAEGRTAAVFARTRFLRLYPAFFVSMTVTAVMGTVVGQPRFAVSLADWLANLPLFSRLLDRPSVDSVYWSLELEVIFYFWVWLFVRLGWFQSRRPLLIASWLGLSVLINLSPSSKALHALFLSDYASLFATGMILFDLMARGRVMLQVPLLLLALPMSMVGVLARGDYVRGVLHTDIDDRTLVLVLLALHVFFVAALFARRLPRLAPILGILGAVSYPLYLLHQHIGYMLLSLVWPQMPAWLALALVAGAMITASAVLASWVEPPVRAWFSHVIDGVGANLTGARQSPSARPNAAMAVRRTG